MIDLPVIDLTPEEKRILDELKSTLLEKLEARGGELQSALGSIITWEMRRYAVEPHFYPRVGMTEKVTSRSGEEVLAGFVLQPAIHISIGHPFVRNDPAQLLLSIFHEVHHFLNWKNDPSVYEKEKDLPGNHPIEEQHEKEAVKDLHAYLKQFVCG